MYLTLIILPLLGSIASGLLGRKLGTSGSQIITCSSVIITTILAINAFFEVGFNNTSVSLQLFRWLDLESINIHWEFNFDSLTVSMLIPVLIISSLVHIYSIGYMSGDPHNQRFFSYLSLFTFMMIILVTANNLLLMFVGWEGVGVCSYLLVSFWFTRIAANQSSLSAFLTNRVGDCFLTIGMFILIWTMGNIDYATVFSLSPYINENIITLIGICLLIGAMAKSSQIGLHVWLPMAMEGPTPVSALIHAATMVTAGVYLLMRTSPLIEYSSTLLLLCLWIGAITTVFSSLIGLFQQDIKKVIAYSTMSQLGMMVIAIGLSSYNVALFHLINHAFYKGLLFLAAGSVIHAVSDNQDFRKYGGLRVFLPLTYSVMLIASLSLIAFPFMTGFYSKDFILESSYGQFYFSSFVVYYIASIGAIFTTLYSVKVLYLTFLTNPNGAISDYKSAHEGDIYMSLPLIILAVFSIFFGYVTKDIFIGLGTGFFQDNSIFIHPNNEITIETEFAVSHIFKILPLINTILFTIISLYLSEFYPNLLINFKLSRIGYNIFGFFNQRFLIELFYNKYITNVILKLGGQTTKILDKGSVEYLGPHGLSSAFTYISKNIGKLDSSVITSYALYILSGLVFYMFINYTKSLDDVIIIIVLYGFLTLTNRSTNMSETLGFYTPPKLLKLKTLNSSFNLFTFNSKKFDNKKLKKTITYFFLSINISFSLLAIKYPIKIYLNINGYNEDVFSYITIYLIFIIIFKSIYISFLYLLAKEENVRLLFKQYFFEKFINLLKLYLKIILLFIATSIIILISLIFYNIVTLRGDFIESLIYLTKHYIYDNDYLIIGVSSTIATTISNILYMDNQGSGSNIGNDNTSANANANASANTNSNNNSNTNANNGVVTRGPVPYSFCAPMMYAHWEPEWIRVYWDYSDALYRQYNPLVQSQRMSDKRIAVKAARIADLHVAQEEDKFQQCLTPNRHFTLWVLEDRDPLTNLPICIHDIKEAHLRRKFNLSRDNPLYYEQIEHCYIQERIECKKYEHYFAGPNRDERNERNRRDS